MDINDVKSEEQSKELTSCWAIVPSVESLYWSYVACSWPSASSGAVLMLSYCATRSLAFWRSRSAPFKEALVQQISVTRRRAKDDTTHLSSVTYCSFGRSDCSPPETVVDPHRSYTASFSLLLSKYLVKSSTRDSRCFLLVSAPTKDSRVLANSSLCKTG